jgi:cytoskeleton protein RodZ
MNQQQALIPMATGEMLKQARLEKKLSLERVAEVIHLDAKVLTEIEEDRAGHIAPVYLKGYLQRYARYLEIPEDDIRAMLDSSTSSDPALRNIFTGSPRRNPLDSWLRATSYVLASLLIGTLAWQFTHEAVRLSQHGPGLQESVSTEARGESPSRKLQGPVNASIAPLGALHDGAMGDPDPAEQAWAALTKPQLQDGESLLELQISADSWVEITDMNGRELEMDLLRGGTNKRYRGEPPFRILIGRASAVHLFMDGDELDLTTFTKDDVAQFQWPEKRQDDAAEMEGG